MTNYQLRELMLPLILIYEYTQGKAAQDTDGV